MKIKLKYQLCALVSIVALGAVGVLTLVTWFYTYDLVFDLRATRLQVIADLKSRELQQALGLYTITAKALAARLNIINALSVPPETENFAKNWTQTTKTFSTMLTAYNEVLYVAVSTDDLSERRLNLTTLPGWEHFKDELVPLNGTSKSVKEIFDIEDNLTGYSCNAGAPKLIRDLVPPESYGTPDEIVTKDVTDDGLFLGPKFLNHTNTYIASLTVPVYNNTTIAKSIRETLGYVTIVFDISNIMEVANNTKGLGETGQVMILGPSSRYNRMDNSTGIFKGNNRFKVLLPPKINRELALNNYRTTDYPVLNTLWSTTAPLNGVNMDTRNIYNKKVSVGYSSMEYFPSNNSFVLVVEQGRDEAFEPMYKLRQIVLGTVFGMFGVILLLTLPLAHFATRQIGRLYVATKLAGRPPEYQEEPKTRKWPFKWPPTFSRSEKSVQMHDGDNVVDSGDSINSSGRREIFRIPQKVEIRKHWVDDELTGLSYTFNDMTDELLAQYENLDAKVRQRTEELEQQKTLAESANEAKTMFIANVSHELRTPLNGILGMCALVLEESGLPERTRENLEVVFKSGELLSHLLNDLLTFSRNQVWGAQVKLEPSPFRVRDVAAQIMALFGEQARNKRIDLTYEIVPTDGIDWVFTGDVNRILQVVINLINNSLKFTPDEGSVQLMIVMEPNPGSSNITPYTDVTDTPDYITSAAYNPESPVNALRLQHAHKPTQKLAPTRPPLFSRRSTSTGIVNPDSEITKTIPGRFKKYLSTTQRSAHSRSRSNSPTVSSENSMPFNVEFRVIDTGPGVAEHMKEKIFEPFVQGDAGLSRKFGGTGLGLSICQQLSRLMGGDVLLKSFEGAGSTFTLRIPLMSASPGALSSFEGSTDPTGKHDGSRSSIQRSMHTTTKSLSMLSAVRDVPSGPSDGNLRLVGMSQPFFVPDRPDDEDKPPERPPYSKNPNTFATEGTEDTEVTVKPEKPPISLNPPTPPQSESTHVTDTTLVEDVEKLELPENTGPLRVLVAEDNKVNQKVLVKLLQLEKVGPSEIIIAEDGVQAVEKVKEGLEKNIMYDVIFMDIQMPNMDGHESTRLIRELGHKFPIIALTAFAEESNIKQCFESGMDCFLAKPIKRAQIKQMLKLYCPNKFHDFDDPTMPPMHSP